MAAAGRISPRAVIGFALWLLVAAACFFAPIRAAGQSIVKSQDIVYRKVGPPCGSASWAGLPAGPSP